MATIRERETSASSNSLNGEAPPQPVLSEKPDGVPNSRLLRQDTDVHDPESQVVPPAANDVFGNEEGADVRYRTCKW
jgi:hypothetical protein